MTEPVIELEGVFDIEDVILDDNAGSDSLFGGGGGGKMRVTVSPPFGYVADRLVAGGKALMPLTRTRIRIALAPAIGAVRQSARSTLPQQGGLNEWVANASYRTSVLRGPKTAGVSIRGRKTGHNLKEIDAGKVRHPVYGNRNNWATTYVPPGYFTRPLQRMRPQVELAILKVMRDVARTAGFKDR
jgi:hypothetical protein